MNEFKYRAVVVQQKPGAAPFYLLSASAEALLEWADVPRTKAAFMAGYQRELGTRHTEITQFLEQDPANVIPGAVIVALQDGTYEIGSEDGGIVDVTITFEEPTDLQTLAAQVLASFEMRLSEDELASIADGSGDVEVEEDEDADVLIAPDSYVAAITRELRLAVEDIDALASDKREAVTNFLWGVSRPGLILDGQHRVFGAKDVNPFDVHLPVVVMPGLAMSEQVFHFYVLNNKAKPLKPVELRRTISTALTLGEIDELYERFKQAKLDAQEARWTHLVDTRSDSPFAGLLNRGVTGSTGFIPENVMDQTVRAFMKMSSKYRRLYSGLEDWTDPEYRMALFFAFWDEVRKTYPNAWASGVADGGGQIFQKVALLSLQENALDQLNVSFLTLQALGQDSPLSSEDALRTQLGSYLKQLPEDFFVREWQRKGLDTGDGRQRFRDEIDKAVRSNGKNLGNMWLFKNNVA